LENKTMFNPTSYACIPWDYQGDQIVVGSEFISSIRDKFLFVDT
jgi:hypothetical protein